MHHKRITPTVQAADADHQWLGAVHVTLPSAFGGVHAYITHAELQELVQQAYDQYGTLALPWLPADPVCNGTPHCVAEHHHGGCVHGARVLEVQTL